MYLNINTMILMLCKLTDCCENVVWGTESECVLIAFTPVFRVIHLWSNRSRHILGSGVNRTYEWLQPEALQAADGYSWMVYHTEPSGIQSMENNWQKAGNFQKFFAGDWMNSLSTIVGCELAYWWSQLVNQTVVKASWKRKMTSPSEKSLHWCSLLFC